MTHPWSPPIGCSGSLHRYKREQGPLAPGGQGRPRPSCYSSSPLSTLPMSGCETVDVLLSLRFPICEVDAFLKKKGIEVIGDRQRTMAGGGVLPASLSPTATSPASSQIDSPPWLPGCSLVPLCTVLWEEHPPSELQLLPVPALPWDCDHPPPQLGSPCVARKTTTAHPSGASSPSPACPRSSVGR